ncbi:MAG: family 20 glycosylhydrolase, partial [Acidobacteria bacterium]|nr:family 20 glycosylhydrolase [Acidobacteriota bacterium]
LMPWPASIEIRPGARPMLIDPRFSLLLQPQADARLEKAARIFLDHLRRRTGMLALDFAIAKIPVDGHTSLAIRSEAPSPPIQTLDEDESYSLTVQESGAELTAPSTLGAMRGLETFLQLVKTTAQGFGVPAVAIHDRPRFRWRGLMLDCSRHFFPLEVIKRNLDGMAALKLNVFHWHLSDNQGFRAESRRFPKLQEMGSDGLYYSQEEMREIVRYAYDRGIRVVPEFDMPGHSTAWFVGYPELASAPGPYAMERRFGVFDPTMDPTRESTYKFLDQFIGEMAKVFPDEFFHIGGDEVNGKQWDRNPKIQEFMHSHQFNGNRDLQAYFNERIEKLVSKRGKTMIGWDEILHSDLPKKIVIQSWSGQQSLADAVRQGYRGLLSHGYYLDLMSTAASHYAVDPLAEEGASLSSAEKEKVLGGEACMWAEYVSPENVDSRIWPRLAAIAERLWSPATAVDVDRMYARLESIGDQLDMYGLTHNTYYSEMLQHMAGSHDTSALRTLAEVVEPVKGYSRAALAQSEPTALMPLNRLVDVAQPESLTARHFAALVDELISGQLRPGVEPEIHRMLGEWRNNAPRLRPMAENSALLREVMPLAESLSALGAAGLEALDYMDRGEKPGEAWKAEQLAQVDQAASSKAQVLLMIASPVHKLIQATAGEKPTELVVPKVQP